MGFKAREEHSLVVSNWGNNMECIRDYDSSASDHKSWGGVH